MNVTLEQLAEIMPHGGSRIFQFLEPLNRGMAEFGIDTPARQAAFLAQLAHESGEFRYVEELASGAAYEGRKDLGNTRPGDGRRYKGRGLIQLTGRANYRRLSKHFGYDFEARPELVATPEWAARSACWFWRHGNGDLNPLADAGSFQLITRRINGGLNGFAERARYWEVAVSVLNAAVPPVKTSAPAKSGDLITNVTTTATAIGGTAYGAEKVVGAISQADYAVKVTSGFWGTVRGIVDSELLPWLLLALTLSVLIGLGVRQYLRRRRGHEV